MGKGVQSRLLILWYTLLCLIVADLAVIGLAHYLGSACRRAVWDEFNRGAARWEAVDKIPYAEAVNRWGKNHQVSPRLAAAVIEAESSFQPRALSPSGAYGLMQVIPGTWQHVNSRLKICKEHHGGQCTTACYFQPELNIGIGTGYLSELLTRYKGDAVRAVAAYNAGPGAVDRYGAVPPYRETEEYVERVITYWYKGQGKSVPVYGLPARRWEQTYHLAWLTLGILLSALLGVLRAMNRRYHSWRWR